MLINLQFAGQLDWIDIFILDLSSEIIKWASRHLPHLSREWKKYGSLDPYYGIMESSLSQLSESRRSTALILAYAFYVSHKTHQ
jgi:hypothetical protein